MTAAVHIHRLPLRAASQALAGAGAGLRVWGAVSIAVLLGRAGRVRDLGMDVYGPDNLLPVYTRALQQLREQRAVAA